MIDLEIGRLVEVKKVGSTVVEKMAIVKVDNANEQVFLEDPKSGIKMSMSFQYFMESTGIELDTRTLLKG